MESGNEPFHVRHDNVGDIAQQTLYIDGVRVDELVSQSCNSMVYRGYQLSLDRQVAIKILQANHDSRAVERFRRELSALNTLRHQNIVETFKTGLDPYQRPYIVMEWLTGQTLEQYLKQHGKLNYQSFMQVFLPVIDALAFAHSKSIVHRDIKPSNIFVERVAGSTGKQQADAKEVVETKNNKDPEVLFIKLVDFGIAKDLNSDQQLTATGAVAGTGSYMSPEQCTGSEIDTRSDIYSLCCTMYEAACGIALFSGESELDRRYRHLNDNVEKRLLQSALPQNLLGIMQKGLQREPGNRYRNIEELRVALEGLDHFSAAPRRPSIGSFGKPAIVGIGIAIAMSTIVILYVGLLNAHRGGSTSKPVTTEVIPAVSNAPFTEKLAALDRLVRGQITDAEIAPAIVTIALEGDLSREDAAHLAARGETWLAELPKLSQQQQSFLHALCARACHECQKEEESFAHSAQFFQQNLIRSNSRFPTVDLLTVSALQLYAEQLCTHDRAGEAKPPLTVVHRLLSSSKPQMRATISQLSLANCYQDAGMIKQASVEYDSVIKSIADTREDKRLEVLQNVLNSISRRKHGRQAIDEPVNLLQKGMPPVFALKLLQTLVITSEEQNRLNDSVLRIILLNMPAIEAETGDSLEPGRLHLLAKLLPWCRQQKDLRNVRRVCQLTVQILEKRDWSDEHGKCNAHEQLVGALRDLFTVLAQEKELALVPRLFQTDLANIGEGPYPDRAEIYLLIAAAYHSSVNIPKYLETCRQAFTVFDSIAEDKLGSALVVHYISTAAWYDKTMNSSRPLPPASKYLQKATRLAKLYKLCPAEIMHVQAERLRIEGKLRESLQQSELAMAKLDTFVNKEPNTLRTPIYLDQAYCYLELHQLKNAARCLEKAHRSALEAEHRDDTYSRILQGICQFRLGNFERAEHELRLSVDALERDPSIAAGWVAVAKESCSTLIEVYKLKKFPNASRYVAKCNRVLELLH